MGMVVMSKRELNRLDVLARLDSDRLTARATSNERRIKRWEHEHVVEAAQTRLDQNPQAMRVRRETVEHPFGWVRHTF
jgi:hypothetical protein